MILFKSCSNALLFDVDNDSGNKGTIYEIMIVTFVF